MKCYLDNAASTKLDPRVRSAMLDAYGLVGNADSLHRDGSVLRDIVEDARERIGKILHADRIIFTSGATEANNLTLYGQRVLTTAIEHSSILESCKREKGVVLPVDRQGSVSTSTLMSKIPQPETHNPRQKSLVSAGFVNNEVGTVANLKAISKVVKERGGVFHSDSVQAAPAGVSLRMNSLGVDALSLSAHKIHGPQGIGCLALSGWSQKRWSPKPLILGGGQQYGLRSGTLPVALIVGLAKSLELLQRASLETPAGLSQWFSKKLVDIGAIPTVKKHSWNIVSVRFPDVESSVLLGNLDARGISASAGSACHAKEDKPSHVLKALGLSDKESRETVRFSLSRFTTKKEVSYAVDMVGEVVGELRG